jgi:hypothetical protein
MTKQLLVQIEPLLEAKKMQIEPPIKGKKL